MGAWWVFGGVSVALHVLFLASIFDIHFRSPVLRGMSPHRCRRPPPAKRLVLVVADGLRADKLFSASNTLPTASYLNWMCETQALCGVSHTHVPTESRPGHVALIAGLYEDVSAITKGWKENPVEFDSLFNQSRSTWSWGSPDILPMFAKGSSSGHVFAETYDAKFENFASANASALDQWVFDRVEEFLNRARSDRGLRDLLSADQIVFFLHLLGMDTIGHGHKPTSPDYFDAIRFVDSGVKRTVRLIERFYPDEKTAYIFTADHGMTDWGSHGAGSEDETKTPLVAWGAGVRRPSTADRSKQQFDVNQVDIAPLMAALIGVNFPMNSMGVLPLDYVHVPGSDKACMLFANAQQILEQCSLQREIMRKTAITLYFQEYSKLTEAIQDKLETRIKGLFHSGQFDEVIRETQNLIALALDSLHYYHTYDFFILSCSIVLGFLAWMTYVITVIAEHSSEIWIVSLEQTTAARPLRLRYAHLMTSLLVAAFLSVLLYVKQAAMQYYLYFLAPVFLWTLVDYRFKILLALTKHLRNHSSSSILCSWVSMFICGIEILVISFFVRALLSLGLVIIAAWSWTTSLRRTNRRLCLGWSILCLVLAIFPMLPVAGKDTNYSLVCLSGWSALILIGYTARRPEVGFVRSNRRWQNEPASTIYIIILQLVLLSLSIYVVQTTGASLSRREGLPLFNQLLSWGTLGLSFATPFCGSLFVLTRLLHISTSMMAVYTLMSTSYENLFLLFLTLLMFVWLLMEFKISAATNRLQDHSFAPKEVAPAGARYWSITLEDVRRAYFSIYFLLLAFFGTGNIASINSFDPASVLTFLTVFNPFVMGSLLLLKVMVPFLIVSCTIYSISKVLQLPAWSLFLLILLMSDFMGLHFFLLVRNTGSWLEIGMSISHYIIVMMTAIIFMFLYVVARIVTGRQLVLFDLKFHFQ